MLATHEVPHLVALAFASALFVKSMPSELEPSISAETDDAKRQARIAMAVVGDVFIFSNPYATGSSHQPPPKTYPKNRVLLPHWADYTTCRKNWRILTG
jgi:hypothetical protein